MKKKIFLLTTTVFTSFAFSNVANANTSAKTSRTVSFKQGDVDGGNPVLPGDGDGGETTITPPEGGKSEGPVRFEYIPIFNFGKQEISPNSEKYAIDWMKNSTIKDVTGKVTTVKNYPQFVQIADETGNKNSSWSVGVKMTQKFSTENKKSTLEDTVIKLNEWQQVNSQITDKVIKGGSNFLQKITTDGINFGSVNNGKASRTRTSIVFAKSNEFNVKDPNQIAELEKLNNNGAVTLETPSYDVKLSNETYTAVLTWELSMTK